MILPVRGVRGATTATSDVGVMSGITLALKGLKKIHLKS